MKTLHIFFSTLLFAFTFTLFNSCSVEKNKVRVMSFNIRYDNPADSANVWTFRKDSVAAYIQSTGSDIIGMQEVLNNQLNDLQTELPDYAYVGVGREDGHTKGEYAPIFYRKDKFELVDGSTFWLSESPDSVSLGWDAACVRIATWAKLKNKQTGAIFLAVNTHFDHVGVEARRQSALLIIEKIKEIVGEHPTMLTGDFNVSDSSEAYQTLTTNAFVLKDAWKVASHKEGVEYTFHDFGRYPQDQREKIDFIFVTPNITVGKAVIKSSELSNGLYLTDHNPHFADLEF